MKVNNKFIALLSICIFIHMPNLVCADIVHLKNGNSIEGEILEESDSNYRVNVGFGAIVIIKEDVVRIDKKEFHFIKPAIIEEKDKSIPDTNGQRVLLSDIEESTAKKIIEDPVNSQDIFIGKDGRVYQEYVNFSGRRWRVKNPSARFGPGPNYFSNSTENVQIDSNGYLHLRIKKREKEWYCAEVILDENLGYGKYSFEFDSPIHRLDENIVLGLFTWDDEARQEYCREFSIKITRWGIKDNDNIHFIVQPFDRKENVYRTRSGKKGNGLIYSFDWYPDKILFCCYDGERRVIRWEYIGPDVPKPGKENARINLWLYKGDPPSNKKEAEVIIKSFTYISPADGKNGGARGGGRER